MYRENARMTTTDQATEPPTQPDRGSLLDRAVRQYRASTDPTVAAAWLEVIRELAGQA